MKAKAYLPFAGTALAAVGAAYSLPGQAHHSFSTEFDSSKPLVVEGVITKARLVNPHSWIYLDVKNADGTVTNWGFEFSTPLALRTKGITRDEVTAGKKIRLSGFRAKNGGAFGYAATVAFQDGRQVSIGGAPDAPALALR